jgi:Uma2 family endonuclease
MTTATAIPAPTAPPKARTPRRMTQAQFLSAYSDKEDGYKYEFNNGIIEKSPAMNQQQAIIQIALFRFFIQTKVFKNGGLLTAETDMQTSREQLRRPDLAIYTGEQVKAIKSGHHQVAPWVAEVISPTDNADRINEKMEEYFRAGVQCVWHIYPATQRVDVFTSPNDVKICRGEVLCSGGPAIPDLEVPAGLLFE